MYDTSEHTTWYEMKNKLQEYTKWFIRKDVYYFKYHKII